MTLRNKLRSYFCSHDRGWVLSIIILSSIVYMPFLGNPYFFDDENFFNSNVLGHYANVPFQFDLRWFAYASFGWTYSIFSDVDTYFFHLGNLLIHTSNAILLFYLLRQLIDSTVTEVAFEKTYVTILGAWQGALLFACHPVAAFAVGYIIQRSTLLATFFALIMQLAYLRSILTGQKLWFLLSVVSYFMAVFSKEHSLLMPLVLAVQHVMVLRAKRKLPLPKLDARALTLCWGAFLAIAALLLLSVKGVLGTPYEPAASVMFERQGLNVSTTMLQLLSFLTQAELFFKYLWLWALPNPSWMSIDMREPFVESWSSLQSWFGAIAFIAYGVFAAWMVLRPRWQGLIGYSLLYPWLMFLVEFSTIRVQETFVLYRSYLWMPSLMLLVPILLHKFPGRRTVLAVLVVILLLIPISWNRLWIFSDGYRLWNDAASLLDNEQTPGSDRILYNRGRAAAIQKKWDVAVVDYEKAVERNPQNAIIRHDLGVTYANLQRYPEAITQFDMAIVNDPEYAKAYFDKGFTLKLLHQNDLAMQQMVKSCELKYAMACLIVKMAPTAK